MNLLALDTSTDTLSIAVQKGGNGSGAGLLERSAPGGAQSSTTLIPLIRELMGELGLSFDELDLIAFGRGPGSFTGLRTACSVAQGLAFGARKGLGVPVLPVDSLLAVAEQARMEHGVDKVLAVLDARMDEVYAAAYRWDGGQWSSAGDYQLLAPQHVIVEPGFTVAGNAQAAYGERLAPDAPRARPADGRGHAAPGPSARRQRNGIRQGSAAALHPRQGGPDHGRARAGQAGSLRTSARMNAIASTLHHDSLLHFELLSLARLDALLEVENAAYTHPWTRGNFIDAIAVGYQIQLLMQEDQIVGYFVAMQGVDEVHLLNITVAPRFQQQGWARVLLDSLVLWSRGRQAQWLWLEVRQSNLRAQHVYLQYGFQSVGQRKRYYPAENGEREDAIVMSIKL